MTSDSERGGRPASLAVGAALIALGLLILGANLAGAVLGRSVGDYLWPFFVIVPGVLMLVGGFAVRGDAGLGLVIPGSIVTAVGTLLFAQNLSGWWATWAYAWALIAPTSIGLGIAAFGLVRGRKSLTRDGLRLAAIGAIVFLVGAAFFELILDISGFGLGRWGVTCAAALLIGLGMAWLIGGLLRGRTK